jgi:hypothetical protein
MLYTEIIAVCSDNHMKPMYILWINSSGLSVKTYDTYITTVLYRVNITGPTILNLLGTTEDR